MRSSILLAVLASLVQMAPGFGRPAVEIQIDRLIATYEESMEPHQIAEWLQSQPVRNSAIPVGRSLVWMSKDPNDGAQFFASVYLGEPLQSGTIRVRADGIQIHSSLMVDGSVVWAFQHPDGRVYRRTQKLDGTVEYAGPHI